MMELTPDGKKGRKDLKLLLEEVAINLVNKPNLVAKNLELLKVVA